MSENNTTLRADKANVRYEGSAKKRVRRKTSVPFIFALVGGFISVAVFYVLDLGMQTTLSGQKDRLASDIVAILQTLPLLGFGVSFILTIMVTYYASTQHRRSVQAQDMATELADKNTALRDEIQRGEKLNADLKRAKEDNIAIIDSISDAIFELNTNGDIMYVSAAWSRITRFPDDQTQGKNLFLLLNGPDQNKERHDFQMLVRGQKSAYRTFTRLRTQDGTFRAIELSFSMLRRTEDGELRVVGTITDVEERRRAERALGEAEKRFRAIVENAAWGIYQITPEGIILSANESLVRILGYKNDADLMHKVQDAYAQLYPDQEARRLFLREVDVKGAVNNHEVQILRADGSVVWVSENTRAVKDEGGSVLYYEGSLEDITDRKESHTMLQEAKIHSDMANRAKSEFLTNMSHELRTPLNAIIGFSEIIKTEAYGPLGHDSYKDYIHDIHNSGQNLLQIINEILDISRVEVSARELNESYVEMGDVVNRCLDLLENKIASNGIEIVNLLDDVPPVIAEERALKQIYTNLLSNAVKFTPRGGRVTLGYEVGSTGDLKLTVADTGIGLEPAQIKKALAPFGQVDVSLSQDQGGIGLGLTLVQALTELHGGKLDILSQKGIGTTVVVRLPAKRLKMASGEAQDAVSDIEAETRPREGA